MPIATGSGAARTWCILPLVVPLVGTIALWSRPSPGIEAPIAPMPTLPDAHAIGGRILDALGNAAPGAIVRAMAVEGPRELAVTETDREGRFRLPRVREGALRIVAEHAAGLVESMELPSGAADGVVLVLEPARDVSGRVLDERGIPIAGATLKVEGAPAWFERIVTTDERGGYIVRAIPRGAGSLRVWARGFVTSSVALEGAAATSQDVRLAPLPMLRGFVRSPWGKPVEGAQISACEGDDAESAISDASGNFELPATTLGCTATARHARFSEALPVAIRARGDLVLRLSPGGSINGMALDERGRPMTPATVGLEFVAPLNGSGGVAIAARSPQEIARGAFHFHDLAPGTYILTASAPDQPDVRSSPIRVLPGRIVRGVALTFGAAPSTVEPAHAEGQSSPSEPAPPEPEETNEETPSSVDVPAS